ncbi:gamma subclass chorismate mutase AroQ [Curtobacterium herbarum]|uniref:chorismate mutase n=1 Tax=Curtobacterium herbarum TaxID=150122 RepID=A0ABN1ZCA6_9MICO|nr:gamma subclass chorismate mutase AroQ [Curtobacterium herbarum]MBM7476958.1 chorismate mutase [Curtobacterium herbarum]MCS6545032.1 gamma subclass chorismate mutase AroQ [Curtobacterium herbarum]
MNSTMQPTRRSRTQRAVVVVLAVALVASTGVLAVLAASPASAATTTSEPAATTAPGQDDGTHLDAVGALVLRRLLLADPVAQSKWLSGKPIADPVREQAVVDEAVSLARQEGVDPDLVTRVVRSQISASKVVQRGLITSWTHDPASAPTTAPDLATIRPQLDAIDTDLVAAIGAAQATAHDPRCAHLVVAERKRLSAGLDSLHRKGVRDALSGFCTA